MAFKRAEHYLDLVPLEGRRSGGIIYPSLHRLLVNTLSGEFKKDHGHKCYLFNFKSQLFHLLFSDISAECRDLLIHYGISC